MSPDHRALKMPQICSSLSEALGGSLLTPPNPFKPVTIKILSATKQTVNSWNITRLFSHGVFVLLPRTSLFSGSPLMRGRIILRYQFLSLAHLKSNLLKNQNPSSPWWGKMIIKRQLADFLGKSGKSYVCFKFSFTKKQGIAFIEQSRLKGKLSKLRVKNWLCLTFITYWRL